MTDIELKIREQKNKCEENQMEFSILHDERKKAEGEESHIEIQSCTGIIGDRAETIITLVSDSCIPYSKVNEWVNYLNGNQVGPNWDDKGCLDLACRDYDGKWHYAASKEALANFNMSTLVHREPDSYVDWDKIPDNYNWVAIDKDGKVWAYRECPELETYSYTSRYICVSDSFIRVYLENVNNLPAWDKSLIHRPGIKE
jgi:hypothetical protein